MLRALALVVVFASGAASADELTRVVDRYAMWRGGAAFEHVQAIHLKGSLDTAGLHGTEEVWADRDGRERVDADLGVLKTTQVVASRGILRQAGRWRRCR